MIRTVSDLINELGNIRDRLTSSDIPVSVDGKEIYSVELVDDGGCKAVIKTMSSKYNSGLPHCPNCSPQLQVPRLRYAVLLEF